MMAKSMNMVKEQVREGTLYTLPEVGDRIKLNQNENPYDLPEPLKRKITEALQEIPWNRYPRLGSPDFRNRVGDWLELDGSQVMVGNGSNEILLAVMNTLLEPGKQMVTIEPTFSLYQHYGELFGAKVNACRLRERFTFPVEQIVRMINQERTALTVLCSPNNPTGSVISESGLRKILGAGDGFVLVDEAYLDFCEQDFNPLLKEYDNLILTRTFSKAFAFAAGRFGYGLASPEFVEQVYKVLLPYNLNGLTEAAAGLLLDHEEWMEPVISEIVSERDRLIHRLNEIQGVEAFPSQSNFFLIRPECDSDRLYNRLLDRGILIRDVSHYPGLENYLRISTGRPEENRQVISTMQEILPELMQE